MAEYKNGVNAFGNMTVSKEDRSSEVHTGRAVFVDEDKYSEDPDYKLKVDKCLAEGFHRVGDSGGGGSSDFSAAEVTIVNNTANAVGLDGGISGTAEGFAFVVNGALKTRVGVAPNTTGIFTALLMNDSESPSGKSALYEFPFEGGTFTTAGDCIMDGDTNEVTIYGDCTITIS